MAGSTGNAVETGAFRDPAAILGTAPTSGGRPPRLVVFDAGGVLSKSGIRIFHDLLDEDLRSPDRIPALLAMELAMRTLEPWASLAQHIHFVGTPGGSARKAGPAAAR